MRKLFNWYGALFVFQALLIGAMGTFLFKKEKEEILRIEQKVDELLAQQGVSHQKVSSLSTVN